MINHFKSYPLKKHNTFGIAVKAKDFYEYSTVEELESILCGKYIKNHKILNLGAGSNILFLSDFKGVVLHSKISGMQIEEETDNEVIVSAGAGILWDDFVLWCVNQGFGGIENLSFIPGTVGASAIQNIGAYGVELKSVFYKLEGIFLENLKNFTFFADDCNFGYRASIFKDSLKDKTVITRLFLKLSKNPVFNLEYGAIKNELDRQKNSVTLENIREAVKTIRDSKLPNPSVIGNAGSFFKNPLIYRDVYLEIKRVYRDMPYFEVARRRIYKIPAAWLIEKAGWKDMQIGRAGVYQNQPLVLVNLGGATGKEILELASEIEKDIYTQFRITLEKEVVVI